MCTFIFFSCLFENEKLIRSNTFTTKLQQTKTYLILDIELQKKIQAINEVDEQLSDLESLVSQLDNYTYRLGISNYDYGILYNSYFAIEQKYTKLDYNSIYIDLYIDVENLFDKMVY